MDHIEATGQKIAQKIALIPILRSGLGMVDSMLELVGDARVHHIGMYRSKSLMPVQYYNRLPKKCEVDVAYVLDPLIATSATIISVAGILKKVRDTYFLTFFKLKVARSCGMGARCIVCRVTCTQLPFYLFLSGESFIACSEAGMSSGLFLSGRLIVFDFCLHCCIYFRNSYLSATCHYYFVESGVFPVFTSSQ